MNAMILQVGVSLFTAGLSAWFGSWLGVRHALRKLRNEKAFERRIVWYEDTVAALVNARDLSLQYALATRQHDAEELARLVPLIGNAFQTLGEKANKCVLYAPKRMVQRLDGLLKELVQLAVEAVKTLEAGQLYEEYAKQTDALALSLSRFIFDLAQEVRGELGVEKIELSDVQRKTLYG